MGHLDQLAKAVAERKFPPPSDEDVEKAAPFLWEMLSQEKWGDGSERILPTIKIERVPGAYRVTLQDDSLCIRKSVIVHRIADLILGLEGVLQNADVPWETFKSYRNKKGAPIPEEKPARRKRS